ncbi:MAG: DLW-39 family protein [Mycobacteriales bacterium]
MALLLIVVGALAAVRRLRRSDAEDVWHEVTARLGRNSGFAVVGGVSSGRASRVSIRPAAGST